MEVSRKRGRLLIYLRERLYVFSVTLEYGLLEEPNKIRRPPNAFMIYANENRKNMAILHPGDSNKEISKKLGCSWRKLGPNDKEKYFLKARAADREHKRKYPGRYIFSYTYYQLFTVNRNLHLHLSKAGFAILATSMETRQDRFKK